MESRTYVTIKKRQTVVWSCNEKNSFENILERSDTEMMLDGPRWWHGRILSIEFIQNTRNQDLYRDMDACASWQALDDDNDIGESRKKRS